MPNKNPTVKEIIKEYLEKAKNRPVLTGDEYMAKYINPEHKEGIGPEKEVK